MKRSNTVSRTVLLMMLGFYIPAISAAEKTVEPKEGGSESPWLLTPLVSSSPKFGTSIGAMAGYLHKFDKESPTSTFSLMGSYSDSDSLFYGLFGRTFFDHDRQRLIAGVVNGEVNNNYKDFLGTGVPVNTTDDFSAIFLRYQHVITGDWYFGPQFLSTDYAISGNDWFSNELINRLGLTGFDSNGIGLLVERDTRDNQNSPAEGSLFNVNNIAYRESLGGSSSFDAYALKFSRFFAHGSGNVLATRFEGRWTNDAPTAGYSTVRLRGYTMGQYLAPHMSMIEVEERYKLPGRWGLTGFTGVACLYGGDAECFNSDNIYPAIGFGAIYMIKVEEKMVIRTEVAKGVGENYGFYLKFGYEF